MKYFLGIVIGVSLLVALFFFHGHYQSIKKQIVFLDSQLSQYDIPAGEVHTLKSNLQNIQERLFIKEQEEKVFTIHALGDMMLDRGVKARVKGIGNNSYDFLFDKIRDTLDQADIVFANLEGSISDVGADTGKPYSFRFEPAVALALKNAGIDVVSLANNHMLDWGRDSLCATITHLNNAEIGFVGAGCNATEAEAPYIITLGNTTLGFLAYTEFYQGAHATDTRAGMTEYSIKKIKERIQSLKQDHDVDLVFVSMHWGDEYKTRAVPGQVSVGRELIDAGVDVVIGHHPHVAQEIERYGNGWIIYSLGNFIFDQSWSEETMKGLMAEIQVKNKRIYDIVPIPIRINNNFQPYLS